LVFQREKRNPDTLEGVVECLPEARKMGQSAKKREKKGPLNLRKSDCIVSLRRIKTEKSVAKEKRKGDPTSGRKKNYSAFDPTLVFRGEKKKKKGNPSRRTQKEVWQSGQWTVPNGGKEGFLKP